MPLFSRKPAPASDNPYEGLRNNWLSGKMAAGAPPTDPDEPFAVLMELGTGQDTATAVAGEDGTASLYLSTGGGIIGAGFHPPTASAALALVGCASSYTWLVPQASTFPRPLPNNVAFHIVTRGGVRSAYMQDKEAFEDANVGPLRMAGEHLITNMRLVDEQRKRGGIRPGKMLAHVFADGGTCIFTEPNPEPTWLTTRQMARVLEIGKARGDTLVLEVEAGNDELQAPALAAVDESGFARVPPPGKAASLYQGGTTTLHYAAEIARADIAKEMIARGADLEARDDFQYTPLILAAFKNRVAVVRALLEGGADPEARDRHGNTVLHFAVQAGDLSAIRALIEAGVPLNVRGQNGYTPLTLARLCKQAEAAKLLVANGAAE